MYVRVEKTLCTNKSERYEYFMMLPWLYAYEAHGACCTPYFLHVVHVGMPRFECSKSFLRERVHVNGHYWVL